MLFKSYIKTAYKTVEKRLIPGFNADISEMQKIAQVLKGINCKKAELFHIILWQSTNTTRWVWSSRTIRC